MNISVNINVAISGNPEEINVTREKISKKKRSGIICKGLTVLMFLALIIRYYILNIS